MRGQISFTGSDNQLKCSCRKKFSSLAWLKEPVNSVHTANSVVITLKSGRQMILHKTDRHLARTMDGIHKIEQAKVV